MSRSYKKHGILKENSVRTPHRYKGKTMASRAVRRSEAIPSGKSGYKKIYCSWNISDYRFIFNKKDIFRIMRNWKEPASRIHQYYSSCQQAVLHYQRQYYGK